MSKGFLFCLVLHSSGCCFCSSEKGMHGPCNFLRCWLGFGEPEVEFQMELQLSNNHLE